MMLAFDLGAGSGRAMLGRVADGRVSVDEVHRFAYGPRRTSGHLRWDVAALFEGVREGLRRAAAYAREAGTGLASIGVDGWGVDYGLLDDHGALVEEPICYRDERTHERLIQGVLARVPAGELFARTGIQLLPINTLFQLAAHVREGLPPAARRLLLIPDLCHHLLCRTQVAEATNASTTQLATVGGGAWDDELFLRLDLPRELMPDIVGAGTPLGTVRPEVQHEIGIGAVPVVAPATHDTGSAVVGTPLEPGGAFISSGTWSLVGVELDRAVVGEAAAAANFTNEAGAFGTVRFLKNVMGLWILEACRREWNTVQPSGYDDLLRGAAALEDECCGLIYPDDLRFLNPPTMVAALESSLRETGQPVSGDPARLTRVVLDSLALRYASVLDAAERLTGSPIRQIHVVGGGSRNGYLNQATADATGKAVLAGPVEATALGNVLVQATASGEVGSLQEARFILARSVSLRRFEPRGTDAWARARERYREIEARCRSQVGG